MLYFLGHETDFTGWFYHFTVIAVYANCCVNPFIYAVHFTEFQRGAVRLFRQIRAGGSVFNQDASIWQLNNTTGAGSRSSAVITERSMSEMSRAETTQRALTMRGATAVVNIE